jgi:transposase-like protein
LQGKELQVAKRQTVRRSWEFRKKAVERMKSGENARALGKELGVHRSLLYRWRDQFAALGEAGGAKRSPEEPGAARLCRENSQLKQALAEKILEVDFFKSALQKVAARRQQSAGARASTTKSGE